MTRTSLCWLPVVLMCSAGCFKGADVSKIFCVTNDNCPSGYICADSTKPGGCVTKTGGVDGAVADLPRSVDGSGSSLLDGAQAFDGPMVVDGAIDAFVSYDSQQDAITVDVEESPDLKGEPDVSVADVPLVRLDVGSSDLPGAEAADAPADRPATDAPADRPATDVAKSIGEQCQSGGECGSTHCADGVCCDYACTGQCQSCNVQNKVGTCSAVTGAPPTGKPACTGSGTCGGSCNGTSPSCAYPGAETSCGSAGCSSGTATSARSCNSAGSCGGATTTPCGSYVCGSTSCLTSCSSVADCVAGAVCTGGSCVACSSGQTICSNQCVNLKTDNSHCGACTAAPCGSGRQCASGVCKLVDGQSCTTSSECASGACSTFYYDGDGDGYPVSGNSVGYCNVNSSPSSSYISARSDGTWDCCDTDSTVNPGVTGYFIDTNNNCHTWDWNCSGQPEKKQVQIAGDCWFDSTTSTCVSTTAPGYPTAACGGAYTASQGCMVTTPGNCSGTTSQNAPVACH